MRDLISRFQTPVADGEVWHLEVGTGNARRLLEDAHNPGQDMPDGRWVLVDRLKPGGGDIWILELAEDGS